MNPLFKIYVNTIEDYFCRLGGNGRFSGYRDWYSPALVLMELIELNSTNEVFKKIKSKNDISDRLWTDTDDLASKTKNQLNGLTLDKQMIEDFVSDLSKILGSYQDAQELNNWLRFVDAVYEEIGFNKTKSNL